jgi:site-specific DNA-methyltransferase (adenine-specific)
LEFYDDVYCAGFEQFIPMIPDDSIQLVFTSPPYEDMVVYRNKDKSEVVSGITGQNWIDTYWNKLFAFLKPKLKDTGLIGVVVNDKRQDRSIRPSVHRAICQIVDQGWLFVEEVPWLKTCAIAKDSEYSLQDWWERVVLFAKSKEYTDGYHPDRIRGAYSESALRRYGGEGGQTRVIGESPARQTTKGKEVSDGRNKVVKLNPEGKLLPNILMVSPDTGRKSNHPARFPMSLARWAIILCTNKGDLVYDPMCGSGTTCIVAKTEGRRFLGSDIGADYISDARKAIADTHYQETMWDDMREGVSVEVYYEK